ncbi:MAG: M14 family zinc carboxypeptidase [Cyclobacteriaceae bacterium]|nr:M14 family zinc carboxypeptidase [Cyclobacteriaceae bacterium]
MKLVFRQIPFLILLACHSPEMVLPPEDPVFAQLYGDYPTFREPSIVNRRFKHADMMRLTDSLGQAFQVNRAGFSGEEREIRCVSFGEGSERVLLWSQMHGNESTATMALMDIFRFFSQSGDGYDSLRGLLRSRLSLYIVPMLNPDGAERFERRNSQGIDINRDALRLQTPEGQLLKTLRDSLQADWGFNLHDQNRGTSVAGLPATLSVLAPAYNEARQINEKRGQAMQVIVQMNQMLQRYIPGQVGRYWDDFEPRAFGDNIQKWGTRTILIESGGLQEDREKQQIRRLNFVAILCALHSIATDSYRHVPVQAYESIPTNEGGLQDFIIRHVQLPVEAGGHLTDMAFRFHELENEDKTDYYLKAAITDLGDLSTSSAYREFDASGMTVAFGKTYTGRIADFPAFSKLDVAALVRQGITQFPLEKIAPDDRFRPLPVPVISASLANQEVQLNANPSLLFYRGDQLAYVLVNGSMLDVSASWQGWFDDLDKR